MHFAPVATGASLTITGVNNSYRGVTGDVLLFVSGMCSDESSLPPQFVFQLRIGHEQELRYQREAIDLLLRSCTR